MAAADKLIFLGKWIVAPAIVGAAGFYFLGPKLGDEVFKPKAANTTVAETSAAPATDEPSATPFPSPSVDIQAQGMQASVEGADPTASPSQRPRRRSRRHRPRPAPTHAPIPPPEDTPPPTQETPPPTGTGDGGDGGN